MQGVGSAMASAPTAQRLAAVRWHAFAATALPFVVVGALWEIAAHLEIFPARLFPALETIASTFVRLTVSGVLPRHAADTVLRLVSGFALAAVVGTMIGIAMGRWRLAEDLAPAARQHGCADPRHRLCALISALVRARQRLHHSAGRLCFGLSHHL